jgi:hypothetical protein
MENEHKKIELDSCNCLYVEDFPEDCIGGCSHPGPCDADVEFWREHLSFSVPRNIAIKGLRGYGAWTREELEAKTDEQLANIVLWLACGDFSDGSDVFCLES